MAKRVTIGASAGGLEPVGRVTQRASEGGPQRAPRRCCYTPLGMRAGHGLVAAITGVVRIALSLDRP